MASNATAPARSSRRKEHTSDGEPPTAPGEQLAPPPKMRRRPALVAASLAAICLGALVSLWAYNSTSNAQSVLVIRQTVERGQVIERDDLMQAVVVGLRIEPAQENLWRLRILAAHESRSPAADAEAIERLLTITEQLECDLEPETEQLLAALKSPGTNFDQLMANAL